jgi:type II secretory pathway predicted ATPase ExeA
MEPQRMYESHFGLERRPFLATPDPDCFVASESAENALAGLRLCIESGNGFGILSAAAGAGKTLMCRKLIVDLRDRYATVFLANSNFPTRRSLLQAILYELGQPYLRMAEQELRLELKTAASQIRPDKQAVLVVVDEAHLLSVQLLEELRTASNIDLDGRPLFHIVLSGQLPLEEKLAEPEQAALSQRIGCQVSLDSLSRRESAAYVAERLRWAGADVSDVLQPDALEMICHAADGSPRCLNQLCDHSLLLAYVAEERPVSEATVREALEDLKQLPLHWNEPRPAATPVEQRRGTAATGRGRSDAVGFECDVEDVFDADTIFDADEQEIAAGATSAVEVGAPVDSWRGEASAEMGPENAVLEIGPTGNDDIRPYVAEVALPRQRGTVQAKGKPVKAMLWPAFPDDGQAVEEELVVDRYAMLDAGLPPAEQAPQRRSVPQRGGEAETAGWTAASDAASRELSDVKLELSDLLYITDSAPTPDQLIDAIEPLIGEALDGEGLWGDEAVASVSETVVAPPMMSGVEAWSDDGGVEADATERLDDASSADADEDVDEDLDEAVEYDVVQPAQPGVPAPAYPAACESKQQRRYAYLFSKLRRQQRSA